MISLLGQGGIAIGRGGVQIRHRVDTSDINNYGSLAEFGAAIGAVLRDTDDFSVQRLEMLHPDTPYQSPLFRANYFSVVLITDGGGEYIVDEHVYPTAPKMLYFTNPGHIKGFVLKRPTKGFIVSFDESFLKQRVNAEPFAEFPFLLDEVLVPQRLSGPGFGELRDLFLAMEMEVGSRGASFERVLGHQLGILLYRIKDMFGGDYYAGEESGRASQIVSQFRRDLENHFRELGEGRVPALHQVRDFAELQYLHPNYLSAVVKARTGKSVQGWIAGKQMSEGQARLARSKDTIQSIAYRVGFQEPGHFSRAFKRYTRQTPSAYRNAVRLDSRES